MRPSGYLTLGLDLCESNASTSSWFFACYNLRMALKGTYQEVHFARFARLIHFLIGKTCSLGLPSICGDSDSVSFSSWFSFSEYGSSSKAPREKPLAIFNKIHTLRELLRSPSFVFFPDVKYVHISWSTLSTNLGHDFGFSGSDFRREAAWFMKRLTETSSGFNSKLEGTLSYVSSILL